MKVAAYYGTGDVRVEERPVPVPGPNQMVVKISYVGICGTDVEFFHGHCPPFVQLPMVLGHENSGVVAAVGEGVTDFKVGDKVLCGPPSHCPEDCPLCQHGQTNICICLLYTSLIRQLLDSFQAVYGLPSSPFSGDEEALAERIAFFSSWDWRFGSAPPFTAQIQGRFNWGGLQLCFSVEQGAVVHTALYSDGLEADFLAGLPACFTGCCYEVPALTARLAAVPADGEAQCRILADAAGLIGQLFHREETSHV